MKQKFRNKIPSGEMRTKYYTDKEKGLYDYWETTAEELTDQIVEIVEYYEEIDIKLTNRQLYYQLVGKAFIPNAMEIYKRICTFLTDLRYCGLVDWDSIEDKARVPKKHSEWKNVSDLIRSATYAYRLPRWQDQDYYVEMYCEKEAGVNVLETISEKYHMYFGFNKGYSSASAMYDLACRIQEQIAAGKSVIILYFGDHDPSGLDMVRDIKDRIIEFLQGGCVTDDMRNKFSSEFFQSKCEKPGSPYYNWNEEEWTPYFEEWLSEIFIDSIFNFEVVPVALTTDQVKQYNPPPNPAKITDPRAKEYIREHGSVSWELDAIDAIELRRLAEDAVLNYLDMKKYNVWVAREKKEIKALSDFGSKLK